MKNITTALLLTTLSVYAHAEHPTSFSDAKKTAEKEIYFDHLTTFYCGCDFVFDDKDDIDKDGNRHETYINPSRCGYTPRKPLTRSGKPNERAKQIEWEHKTPAFLIGGHLNEWKEPSKYPECKKANGKYLSGRDCAYELSAAFKIAHDDLHNLTPSIGELNSDRSNYSFADIPGEKRAYGQCDFEVNFKQKIAEPADKIKGDIARTYLYMNKHYKVPMTQATINLMLQWNELDPVDDWECKKNERIMKVQGNDNPFVTTQCLK